MWSIQGCVAGQGMVLTDSVLNRVVLNFHASQSY